MSVKMNEIVTSEDVPMQVENLVWELIDILAAFPGEIKQVDPRVWDVLKIYIPSV